MVTIDITFLQSKLAHTVTASCYKFQNHCSRKKATANTYLCTFVD